MASIIGFAEATDRFVKTPVFPKENLVFLANRLELALAALQPLGVTLRNAPSGRLANTVAFTARGCESISLLAGLDLEGICASSGSACSAGSLEPSHVMLAMGVPKEEANSLIRFSLGRESTVAEVDFVTRVLPDVITRVLRAS